MAKIGRNDPCPCGSRKKYKACCAPPSAVPESGKRLATGKTAQEPKGATTVQKATVSGPGFVAVMFDVPFPVSVANGHYPTYDPVKGVAIIQVGLREGSRAFFRNRPLRGPTSFDKLKAAAAEYQRPRKDYSYIQTCIVEGMERATLNLHTGVDGGYAETKYYSEITVTFLHDDLARMGSSTYSSMRHSQSLLGQV